MNYSLHEIRMGYYMENASHYEHHVHGQVASAATWFKESTPDIDAYEALCRGEEVQVVSDWLEISHHNNYSCCSNYVPLK